MNTAVIFQGVNALDFEELRSNSLRIPEVLTRVKMAQKIWGDAGLSSFDFVNFIGSSNDTFFANVKLKSLASAIVQIGLYERYLKSNPEPKFLIGPKSGDSAMLYIAGKVTFPELILSSKAALSCGQGFKMTPDKSRLASSVGVSQIGLYALNTEATEIILKDDSKSAVGIENHIRHLVDEESVKKFINIGPGTNGDQYRSKFEMEELSFMESVDCDPMLNWFWKSLNPLEFQVAQ